MQQDDMTDYVKQLEARNELLSNRLEAAEEVIEYIDKNPGRMAFDLVIKEFLATRKNDVPMFANELLRKQGMSWCDIWGRHTLFWFRDQPYNFNDTVEVVKKHYNRFVIIFDSPLAKVNYNTYYFLPFGYSLYSGNILSIYSKDLTGDFNKHKNVLETYSCFIFNTKVSQTTTKKYIKKFHKMFSYNRKNLLFIVLRMGDICKNT